MNSLNKKYLGVLALVSLICAIIIQAALQSLSSGNAGFPLSLVLLLAGILYIFSLSVFVLPGCKYLKPLEQRAITLWDSDFLGRPAARVTLVVVFILLLLLQVNNSSMEQYSMVLPNNIASLDYISLGVSQPVRSDEYLCSTPLFFNDSYNGITGLWADCSTPFQAVANVVSMINPYHWGYLYLPTSVGYSFTFLLHVSSYLYFFYRLFYRATNHRNFSFLFAILVFIAPGLQWWWSAAMRYHCYAGIIVFFIDYFEAPSWKKKLFCAWGILSCASTLLISPYPAWDIPYAYLFLMILVAFTLRDKIWKAFLRITRWDVLLIGITVVLMVCCALATLLGPDVAAQMATIYPGQRFDAGGDIPSLYWANSLASLFLPWKEFTIPGMNLSETSTYLHLFPIPFLIYFARFRQLRNNKLLTVLMLFNVIAMVYMYFGVGYLLAKISLWSYSMPARVSIVWGLSSFLMLLIECYVLRRNSSGKPKTWAEWTIIVCINVLLFLYLVWFVQAVPDVLSYIGVKLFVLMGVGLLILLNLIYFCKGGWAITILTCLSLMSGAVVNPINLGTDVATKTPVAQAIRAIDQESPGHWLVLNDLIFPKYVYMQGVYCPLQLSWPPQMDMFRAVDETGVYKDIYNRYAHITVFLTSEETSFSLNQPDSITINLNTDDLQKWGVDYLVTKNTPLQNTEHTTFEQIYYDDLDGVLIYQVDYQ